MLTFVFGDLAGGTSQAWVAPEDLSLVGLHGDGEFVLSFDPSLTVADFVGNPTESKIVDEFIVYFSGGIPGNPDMVFPINQGQRLFVAAAPNGSNTFFQLYFL